MKIVSWNINGIRSLKNYGSQSFSELVHNLQGDIICLQEVKAQKMQMSPFITVSNYNCFYELGQSAYCGVGTIVSDRIPVIACEQGFSGELGSMSRVLSEFSTQDIKEFNREARVLITDHGDFLLFNVYFPALTRDERLEFKLKFSKAIQMRVEEFISNGRVVIVAGDVNVCYSEIDHFEPLDCSTPCREWLHAWIGNHGTMTDTFRYLYPYKIAYSCFDTYTNARALKLGSRIDYILVSNCLKEKIKDAQVLEDIYGSDHCPVSTDLEIEFKTLLLEKLPKQCTCYWDSFGGRQPTISAFFSKISTGKSKGNGSVSKKSVSPSKALIRDLNRKDILESRQSIIKPDTKDHWSKLFKNPLPKCHHGEFCVVQKSKKESSFGKSYYSCPRPVDRKFGNDERCKFFQWK